MLFSRYVEEAEAIPFPRSGGEEGDHGDVLVGFKVRSWWRGFGKKNRERGKRYGGCDAGEGGGEAARVRVRGEEALWRGEQLWRRWGPWGKVHALLVDCPYEEEGKEGMGWARGERGDGPEERENGPGEYFSSLEFLFLLFISFMFYVLK